MSFTITQQPNSANLYIYPNGDDTTELSVSGATYHYDAINEIWHSPNEDIDYVYTTSTTSVSDIYTVENHTTETGTINYVRVISRGKSYQIQQSTSGVYRHYIHDGSTSAYSSNFAPLTTSYNNYSSTWSTKPSGGTWGWTDIDNIKIGVQVSSPSVSQSYETHLRPIGDYDSSGNWGNFGDGTGFYGKVDEEIADEDNSYIYLNGAGTTGTYWRDFNLQSLNNYYNITNISYVKTFIRGKRTVSGDMKNSCGVNSNGSVAMGTLRSFPIGSYDTYSDEFTTDPDTGSSWTVNAINNLKLRNRLRNAYTLNTGDKNRITQTYVVVSYMVNDSPEIRITQLYAVVNYTPPQSTVTLMGPETLSMNHSRNVTRFLFPDNDYKVEDMGRAAKTLTLTGYELVDGFNKMSKLRDMVHYGSVVSVTGLPDSNLNTTYLIKDFNFIDETGTAGEKYRWSLTLEEAT